MSDPIHVWLLTHSEVMDEGLMQAYRGLLTEEERAQELRFRFPEGRKNYLLTRALVRTVLSRYSSVQAHEWVFTKTDYGRPELSPAHEDAHNIIFNISHTRESIVLAVTRDREIGVDVESLEAKRVGLELARRVFAPREIEALSRLPETLQRERFLELWTLKESYIKARGMGLSIPTAKFGFDFVAEGGLSLSIDAELNDEPGRWRFVQFRPSANHIAAVCYEHTGVAPSIVFTKVVPLLSESAFACPLGRATA